MLNNSISDFKWTCNHQMSFQLVWNLSYSFLLEITNEEGFRTSRNDQRYNRK
jgi:hypothetical protein